MPLLQVEIDDAVLALRPDFAAIALLVSGVRNEPTNAESDAWLTAAETAARTAQQDSAHPHIAAWQEAYRAFGAKPQRTPSSVEALTTRAVRGGLPRVSWLVDLYNAISVRHVLPVGGEDAARFTGSLRLVRASGQEPFDTVKQGQPVVEHPAPGEVVWADEAGVTCRRWNWRQGTRTRLTAQSTDVLFLFERLEPLPLAALHRAETEVAEILRRRFPRAQIERRGLGLPTSVHGAG